MDWNDWHRTYETSPLFQARLRVIRAQIHAFLSEYRDGPIRVVSLCAGDGRDLIGALREHPRRGDVQAWLLDVHAPSLDRGRAAATEAGLGRQLQFVVADASRAGSYVGIAPADLIVSCGFLGHLRNAEALGFLGSLPMLCAAGGSVIWNRGLIHNRGRVQVQAIRDRLRRGGFEEVGYEETAPDGFAVGRARFGGEVLPLDPQRTFFNFVGIDRLVRRDTAAGKLCLDPGGGWRGRFQVPRGGADVELLVEGDDSGPTAGQLAALERLVAHFEENMSTVRGKLFLGWSYRPSHVVVSRNGGVTIGLQSILPLLGPKTVGGPA